MRVIKQFRLSGIRVFLLRVNDGNGVIPVSLMREIIRDLKNLVPVFRNLPELHIRRHLQFVPYGHQVFVQGPADFKERLNHFLARAFLPHPIRHGLVMGVI